MSSSAERPRNIGRAAGAYGVSLLAVGAAFWVRYALGIAVGPGLPPFIIFYPTIMTVALLAGFGPGVLATAVASVITVYWIFPHQGSLLITRVGDATGLGLFFCMGVFMSVVAMLYRRARQGAAAYQQELSVRESESRFSTIFHSSPISMSITRVADGKFVDANEAFLKGFGGAREDVLGHTPVDLDIWTSPEDRQAFFSALRDRESVHDFQTNFRRKSGEIWTGLVSAKTIEIAGEQCIWALSQDITQRMQAEKALRESEERYRGTLDNMLEGCQIIGPDWTYVYINGMAAKHGHSTREELLGKTMTAVYPHIEETVMFRDLRRCMEERVAVRLENEFAFPDGSSQWFDLSFQPVPEGVFILSLDITDRKKSEEEVHTLNVELERRVQERTAELEEANRELDAFAYAVSHDLRAPLRALSGFSSALREDYGATLTGEALNFLDQISLASASMGELIDGLLRLSRSTRGDLRREQVDLSALAEHILGDRARADPDRRVSWTVEPGLVTRGDAKLIEVVLTNLLDNAWKYTARTVDPTVRFTSEQSESGQHFCVADNGAGFDMKHAARLFQPFQRLHRRDEFPGIGIGLATVQRIIHRHGGTIRATGAPGKGATFSFSLAPPNAAGKERP